MALGKFDITRQIRGLGAVDALVILILLALLGGLLAIGQQWRAPYVATVQINLSRWSLFGYCLLSLARNFAAYAISLLLAFWWGLWAAKSKSAEKVLIPLVDILQSIPVLSFMPGLVLGLVHLFPHSRVGLELACVLMIVTSQAWNMILSVYQSVKGIPQSMRDMADNAGLSRRQKFLHMELPYSMTPLVWNSMLSLGNGWFFVTVNEAFVLGTQDFRLPGVGSYMSVAKDQGNGQAVFYGALAMMVMVVLLDQLLWRPLIVWGDRFRVDDQQPLDPNSSPVLKLLGRSRVVQRFGEWSYLQLKGIASPKDLATPEQGRVQVQRRVWESRLQSLLGIAFLVVLALGAWRLLEFFGQVSLGRWMGVLLDAGTTLSRILIATVFCAVWAIPLGVKIGLSPRLSKYMQPVIQILNSYPAPLLFPIFLVAFFALGLSFETASVLLIMIGTFAYLLFNVIGGASQIPQEQKDVWAVYGPRNWLYWRKFILPATLPSLVIGLNTMIGAAWNATIVTEFIHLHDQDFTVAHGLGATINTATESGDMALLTVSTFVMIAMVVTLNRLVWLPLSDYAAKLSA